MSLRDRPRLQFACTMAVFAVVLWIVFRDSMMGPVLVPLRQVTAETTLYLIRFTGLDGLRMDSLIVHKTGFAMEVTRGCTGFAGAAVLSAGILAYPTGTFVRRWIGVLLCLPAFLVVNVTRMTHLYHLGVSQSPMFEAAHTIVWQIAMMATVLLLWFSWVYYTDHVGGVDRASLPSQP